MDATLAELIEAHGIETEATFIPWSKSRKADEVSPSLNWRVTLKAGGRDVLTTYYTAGCGHCPSALTNNAALLEFECENGFPASHGFGRAYRKPGSKRIPFDQTSFLACMFLDASVLDYATFEDWARDMGYDPDSRSAEKIYQACLSEALAIRAAIGDSAMQNFREALADW